MALTDTMFFFEVMVEELKTFVKCSNFCIKGEFADVFSVYLKDPNILGRFPSKHSRPMKSKRKAKSGKRVEQVSTSPTVQTGQTVLFAINVDTLISNMKQYPLELSLWSKDVPDYKIGSTQIPWSAPYFEYLNMLYTGQGQEPICVRGEYAIFEEATSKRIAIVKLSVKLRHLKDKNTTQYRSPSQVNQQTAFPYIPLNSKPGSELSTKVKDRPIKFTEETGIVKTIYSGDKRRPIRTKKKSIKKKETKSIDRVRSEKRVAQVETAEVDITVNRRLNSGVIHLVRSERNLDKNPTLTVIKSKSCSSIVQKRNLNILNDYIFGAGAGPFGNQVYCVSYFTVENDMADPSSPKSPSGNASGKSEVSGNTSEEFEKEKDRYKFRMCKSECLKFAPHSRTQSVISLDITKKAEPLITVVKCSDVKCTFEKMRELPTPPDDRILIDLSSQRPDHYERTEEVVAGMKAKMTFGSHPCYCECECQFGFMKKTTFCNICGGYEKFGEDYGNVPVYKLPFPCPIFHKLSKIKMSSSKEGSDTKKKITAIEKEKELKAKQTANEGKAKQTASEGKTKQTASEGKTKQTASEGKTKQTASEGKTKQTASEGKTKQPASDGETSPIKKVNKKKSDERFKFNYGYTGIPPHIGHSRCALPCVGALSVVPKGMGWLWTCENVPGLKFRPSYKPGAANKHVVRLLKIAKNPDEAFAKKRKKVPGKPKRPLKRPLLIVHKKDGEYTVTMETMRTFTKTRTYNQYPYEDKPVVTYTIGRTSEENLQRKLKKERAKRRLERLQRDFVQSAFRDMCKEICLNTYQQALGLLPDAEKPDCSCLPALPGPDDVDLDHSCSCDEDKSLSESDTDSDEWIVEFTPPTARFDPSYKSKKLATTDNATQYTYMDYKVKLLDRLGNPVPRFFKGPDGKPECSDLGGFWSADHKWQEINVDGFIGPDGRWAPHTFLGPNDELVDGEAGKFQALNGNWLVIGVDGYVEQGKWKNYCKPRNPPTKKHRPFKKTSGGGGLKDKKTEDSWSCFASVTPKQLSKMGIVGHGHDKKLLYSKLKDMKARGENVSIPQPSIVPRLNRPKRKRGTSRTRSFIDRTDCKHATPSDKGILAVDRDGNKKYFRKKDFDNRRPQDRMSSLTGQGISVSSFHVPCYHSFIGTEEMKKQQYDRLVALAEARGAGGTPSPRSRGRSTPSQAANYTGVYVI